MKIIQDEGGYSIEELLDYKYIIYANTIQQMKVLLTASETLNIGLENPTLKSAYQKISEIPGAGDSWSQDVGRSIQDLWQDKGIKKVYEMRDKHYQLNDSAFYFFENIPRFLHKDYVPTVDDVLRSRVRTSGIQEACFMFEGTKYRMLDVGGQRCERRKWIHCFDSVTAVIFCSSLSEYDQTLREAPDQNRMKESLILFDEVCNSHWFKNTAFILFLNKTDLFRYKIAKVDLSQCFPNYTGGHDYEKGCEFIKQRFLEQNQSPHNIFTHFTCAISTENIEFVFDAIRNTVIKQAIELVVV